MATIQDRTDSYTSAVTRLDELNARSVPFEEMESALRDFPELRGDEREALFLYAWGLVCRRTG